MVLHVSPQPGQAARGVGVSGAPVRLACLGSEAGGARRHPDSDESHEDHLANQPDVWQTTGHGESGRPHPARPAGACRGAVPERRRRLRGRPPDLRRAARVGRPGTPAACARSASSGATRSGSSPATAPSTCGRSTAPRCSAPSPCRSTAASRSASCGHAITNAELQGAVLRRRLRRSRRARRRSARGHRRRQPSSDRLGSGRARRVHATRLRRRRAGRSTGPELTLADPAMLLYTSGTTAMPKGCVLSHEALVRPAYAMRDRFALTDEDRMWDALPLFHLASLLPLHACMLAGRVLLRHAPLRPGRGARADGARALHDRVPRLRDGVARDPQPPGLRVAPTSAACGSCSTSARASGSSRCRRRMHVGDADLLLRLHRARRRVRVRPHRGPARAARRRPPGAPVPGHGDPRSSTPRPARRLADRRDRRDHLPRPLDVQRLLPRAGADRAGRSTTTASSTPATSARSTTTAASSTAAG